MDKQTRNIIAGLSISLFAVGCGDSGEQESKLVPVSNQTATSQAGSVEDQLAKLPNAAPLEGMCAGWRRNLAEGRNQNQVAYCLRTKALKDRIGATQEANEMSAWEIKETNHSDLKQLISSLSKYPEAGSLEKRLRELSLLPNQPNEYNNLDKALTATDYLTELGNIHWFDTETGMFPNNHDFLLQTVSEKSDIPDIIFNEVPPSSYDSDSEPYQLTASINGKSYHRKAQNYGDWYDVDAVLSLLNGIAVDQGRQSRFVSLPTGDQTSIIWVVNEDNLRQLVDEGLVQIGSPELSMQIGKEFEERVKDNFIFSKDAQQEN